MTSIQRGLDWRGEGVSAAETPGAKVLSQGQQVLPTRRGRPHLWGLPQSPPAGLTMGQTPEKHKLRESLQNSQPATSKPSRSFKMGHLRAATVQRAHGDMVTKCHAGSGTPEHKPWTAAGSMPCWAMSPASRGGTATLHNLLNSSVSPRLC